MALSFIICCFLLMGQKIQAESNGVVSVRCELNDMEVDIAKDFLPHFKKGDLRLLDPDCKPMKSENESYFTITAPLIGCGTTSEHTAANIIYRNVVKDQYVSEGIISRLQVLEIPFECSYPKEAALPLVKMDIRQASIIALTPEEGSGTFELEMDIFKNEQYDEMYGPADFPIAVSIQQRLYFQISVDTPDPRLGIVADTCFATPVRIRTAQDRYDIITDRCPKDATVKFYDGPLATQRFSFEAFQFVNGQVQPYIFIHCEVILCNGTDSSSQCDHNCDNKAPFIQTRLKRSQNAGVYDLEQGPIVLKSDWSEALEDEAENEEEANGEEGKKASNSMKWLFGVMGIICGICLAAVLDTIRKTRQTKAFPAVKL